MLNNKQSRSSSNTHKRQSSQTTTRFKENLLNNYTSATYNDNSNQNDKRISYNFTVAVRVKPKLTQQQQYRNGQRQKNSQLQYHSYNSQNLVVEFPQNYSHSYTLSKNKKFSFNSVFINRSNRDIYEELIKQKISVLKQNLNFTVLTYGITGSGKTHTIFGNRAKGHYEDGIATMVFEDVIAMYAGNNNVGLKFSYIQIYNQQVHDLLKEQTDIIATNFQLSSSGLQKLKSLNVLQDSNGHLNIPQLSKISIKSIKQIEKLVEKGNNIRACSSNMINKMSSRSHALLQLFCFDERTKIENVVTIIDLAGSQRHTAASLTNQLLNENKRDKSKQKQIANLQKQGSNINRSLLALGNCLKALQSGQTHIPYRDSKLTRIMKEDLSGKSHNIMIACVGRSLTQADETLNTLQYATRAARIKVQENKNCAKNPNYYQCQFCFKGIPWKSIIGLMPQQYQSLMGGKKAKKQKIYNKTMPLKENNGLDQQQQCQSDYQNNQYINSIFDGKNRMKDKNRQLLIKIHLSNLFKNFKKQITELLNNCPSTSPTYRQGLYSFNENNCLFQSCFGSKNQFLQPYKQNNNQDAKNTERQNIQAGITEIFNSYQTKLDQVFQQSMQQQLQLRLNNQLKKYKSSGQLQFQNNSRIVRTFSQIPLSNDIVGDQQIQPTKRSSLSKTLSLKSKTIKIKTNVLQNSSNTDGNILQNIQFKHSLQSFREMLNNQQRRQDQDKDIKKLSLANNLSQIYPQSKYSRSIVANKTIKTKATNSQYQSNSGNSNNSSNFFHINCQSNENSNTSVEKNNKTKINYRSKGPKLELALQSPSSFSAYNKTKIKTQRMNPDVCVDIQTQVSLQSQNIQKQPWKEVFIKGQDKDFLRLDLNDSLSRLVEAKLLTQTRLDVSNKNQSLVNQSQINSSNGFIKIEQDKIKLSLYQDKKKRDSLSKNKSTIMRKLEEAKNKFKVEGNTEMQRNSKLIEKQFNKQIQKNINVQYKHQNCSQIQFSLNQEDHEINQQNGGKVEELIKVKTEGNIKKQRSQVQISSFMQDEWQDSLQIENSMLNKNTQYNIAFNTQKVIQTKKIPNKVSIRPKQLINMNIKQNINKQNYDFPSKINYSNYNRSTRL